MITSIKMFMAIVLAIVGIAAFLIGYTKKGFMLKLIFGRDRVKQSGMNWLVLYLYIAAGVLLFLSVLLLIP